MWSIFKSFFFLGWISFGGPAAHIGYFRQYFVEKHKWLEDSEYAQIVALSQFLPGPGSSQVGFALGYKKGGLSGAIAAFLGFTLPSVTIMLLLAMLSRHFLDSEVYESVVHSLKLLAVVVVADAVWGMYSNFCKSRLTVGICIVTASVLLLVPQISTQMILLMIAGLIGSRYLVASATAVSGSFKPSVMPLLLFLLLLFCLPLTTRFHSLLAIFSNFFWAGSLVFGGGHVVLPLLQGLVGEQVSQDAFMTGYAAAQVVPGPMFTMATYIGYVMSSGSIIGALVATIGIFMPGFLLLLGVLRNWQLLASKPRIAGAIKGVNAAVVGLLLAALYQPVFSSAVGTLTDVALILAGFYIYKKFNLSLLWTILFFVMAGSLVS
ncbi:chorismate-binding protein [Shewanella mangrovi]|uniref:Chorismate-binding protein n=2 Tax=Shewanella TaxID=22 RepID=A0A094JEN7_9GAMM|nr:MULTISPECIES: chromate efflux transporter [Shewanella]KFZ36509.1 chorismate-binding protein [Shewanella mangrovi]QUN05101.1 chromate efflux transporter [Shewanella yunxiaonensis]